MSVYRRDYAKEWNKPSAGETVWAYAFSYRKVRYRAAGFKTKREADLAEEKARHEVILNGRILKPFQMMEFSALAEEVLTHRAACCSPMTVACERLKLKSLNRVFGGKSIDKVTAPDINWFIRKRKGGGHIEPHRQHDAEFPAGHVQACPSEQLHRFQPDVADQEPSGTLSGPAHPLHG